MDSLWHSPVTSKPQEMTRHQQARVLVDCILTYLRGLFCYCCCLKQGLTVYLWLAWNSLWNPGWSWTPRDLPLKMGCYAQLLFMTGGLWDNKLMRFLFFLFYLSIHVCSVTCAKAKEDALLCVSLPYSFRKGCFCTWRSASSQSLSLSTLGLQVGSHGYTLLFMWVLEILEKLPMLVWLAHSPTKQAIYLPSQHFDFLLWSLSGGRCKFLKNNLLYLMSFRSYNPKLWNELGFFSLRGFKNPFL